MWGQPPSAVRRAKPGSCMRKLQGGVDKFHPVLSERCGLNTSSLPRRFAVVGVGSGFACMALYWYDYRFNPFHLPPPPPMYNVVERMMFVLCPGLFLQIFTIGTGDRLGWVMWVFSALLNGPLYYLLGMLVATVARSAGHQQH